MSEVQNKKWLKTNWIRRLHPTFKVQKNVQYKLLMTHVLAYTTFTLSQSEIKKTPWLLLNNNVSDSELWKQKQKKWPLVYVFVCVELAFCTICTKLRGSLSSARQTTRTQALLRKHVYSRPQCVYVHNDYVSMQLRVHVQYTMKKKLPYMQGQGQYSF